MSDLEKKEVGKLVQLASDIQFENDFGQEPILMGRFAKDQGVIAVCSLVAFFVGTAITGNPLAGIVLLIAGANDIGYASRKRSASPQPSETEPIDVEAREVEEVEPKALPVGQETRLNAIEVESQSVSDCPQPAAQAGSTPNPPAVTPKTNTTTPAPTNIKWIDNFVSQTALIWGNQGSGKSWMARYIAKRKKDKGYRVVVLDPDSNRAEWEGVESYHDFDEIAEFLSWYVEELKGRYKAFNASNMTEDAWRAKLWAEGKAIALICEEVTTYVDLIEDKELLTHFFRLGLTKSRKQEMPLTFVSHNNNQTALGGIKGLANLIDKMLQLELQTDIDPETLQPVASGKGAVKLDGANQWVPVTLPKLERKITNFGEPQQTVIEKDDSLNTPAQKQAWDRLILESTDEQINELIEQKRTKPENAEAQVNDSEKLETIDQQLAFAIAAITEYLQEKKLDSDTARNIYNGKNRLKKVAPKLNEFKDLLELANELEKLSYDTETGQVSLL